MHSPCHDGEKASNTDLTLCVPRRVNEYDYQSLADPGDFCALQTETGH